MDNTPRIRSVPIRYFTAYARKSTTGENYPGTPVTDSVPPYVERLEWLRDETGESQSGRNRFKSCEHYLKKCSLDRPMTDGSDTWVSPGSPSLGYWNIDYVTTPFCWDGARYGAASTYGMPVVFGAWDSPLAGLPLLYEDTIRGRRIVRPDQSSLDDLVAQSLTAMLPGIKPSLSVLNTLAELKDIKSAGRSIGRINDALAASERLKEALARSRHVVKLLTGQSRRALAAASLRTILKSGSDSYLQAQFNIGPLLRDIAGISSAVSSARSQLNTLIANAGRRQVKHYRARLSSHYTPRDETRSVAIPAAFRGVTTQGRREVVYPVSMFYATIEYCYKMPYFNYSPEDYLPGAISDVLGANFNPSIIWNAIPWSFVVDWVVGVNRWLDQFKTRNIEPVTSISRYCYTTHVVRHIKLSHAEGGTPVPFARFEEEAYCRTPHSPDWYRSIELSGLNLKEFSLAGALALSR